MRKPLLTWSLLAWSLLVACTSARAAAPLCVTTPDDAPVASSNFLFGGSKDVMSFDDFKDLRGHESARAAVDWYLHSGITNGGQDWDRFGPADPLPRWEVVHNMYRFYSNMNETGAPFTDAPILFMSGGDTTRERKFFGAAATLRGAGIIEAVDAAGNFEPDRFITREDFLLIFHRSINNADSSRAAGTALPAGTRADLGGYTDAAAVSERAVGAVAALIKAGCYRPAGKRIDPQGSVTRLEMVQLFFALRHTPVPKQMNGYAEARIKALIGADGTTRRVFGQQLATGTANTAAVYAKNAAMIDVANTRIDSSAGLESPDMFAYRWGLGGVVLANGYGTTIDIADADIRSTGSGAYALYATSGGTIHIKDSRIDGGRAAMVTYNGRIVLDNVSIRGTDRTFSSDHFGGTIVYRHVDSVKTMAQRGGGGFFLDENTTGEFYDSSLVGDGFLAVVTGIGRAYFKDTTVRMGTGIELTNNTSLLTDIATVTLDGGDFTIASGDLFTSKKAQRSIIRIRGSRLHLPAGANLLKLQHGSRARLYLDGVDVRGNVEVEDGSSAELYLHDARLHGTLSGKVSVQADAGSAVTRD